MRRIIISIMLLVIISFSVLSINCIETNAISYVRVYFDNYYTQFDKVYIQAGDSQGFDNYEMVELESEPGILYTDLPRGFGLRMFLASGGSITGSYGHGYEASATFDSVWSHQLSEDKESMIFVYSSEGEKYVPYSTYERESISSAINPIDNYSSDLIFSETPSNFSSLTIGNKKITLNQEGFAKGDGWEFRNGYLYIGEKKDFTNTSISADGDLTIISSGNNKLGDVTVSGKLIVSAQVGKLYIDNSPNRGKVEASDILVNAYTYASIDFMVETEVSCNTIEFNGKKNGRINFIFGGSGGRTIVKCDDCIIHNDNSIIYIYYGGGGGNTPIAAYESFKVIGGTVYSGGRDQPFYCMDEVEYINSNYEYINDMHRVHFASDWTECRPKTESINGVYVKRCLICGEILQMKNEWPTREVTFCDESGNIIKKETVLYGDDAIPPDMEKEGYSISWDNDYTNITSDITTNVVWTLNTYQVVFKDSDGKVLSEQTVGYGNAAIAPELTKEGYTLSWDNDYACIKENTVINAKWTINTYKVVFKDLDGTIIAEQTVDHGESVTAPDVTKEGYSLSWDKDYTCIKENTTINAIWTINTYKVVFKNSDGTILSEQTIDYGTAAIAPKLTKEGYTLSWDKDFSSIKNDVIITAVWRLITYDLADAIISADSNSYTYDGLQHKPQITVSYSGKTLIENFDYKLTIEEGVNSGIYQAEIEGIGVYIGRRTINYSIEPASIENANITLNHTIFTYDGSYKYPGVMVELSGKTIVEKRDYKVSYKNNKEVGTAYVVIEGINNYCDVVEVSFRILEYQSGMDAVYKDDDTLIDDEFIYHITNDEDKEVEISAPANKKNKVIHIPSKVTTEDGTEYTVTSIGMKAFYKNSYIKELVIANTVTSIENYAFYGCKNLISIKIGNGIEIIGDSAFRKCTKLTSITLPKSLDKLGKNVFYGCKKLKTITIKANHVIDIKSNAIKNISKKCVIIVPKKLVKKYKKEFNKKSGYKKTMRIKSK